MVRTLVWTIHPEMNECADGRAARLVAGTPVSDRSKGRCLTERSTCRFEGSKTVSPSETYLATGSQTLLGKLFIVLLLIIIIIFSKNLNLIEDDFQ
jgi:hypothetical protein